MSIRLLIRTSERVRVVSPWDPALDAETKRRLLADDIDCLNGRTIDGATWFEVRGLSAGEIRRLRPLLPAPPDNVRAWLAAVNAAKDGTDVPSDERLDRDFAAWQAEVGFVYLRAALMSADIEGWPTASDNYLGLALLPEWAVDGLPHDTGRWLGSLAYRLSMLAPEKKRPFGSPLAEPSGTTADATKSTGAASG